MIAQIIHNRINLDLAFQGLDRDLTTQINDKFKTIFLFEKEPWSSEIQSWFNFIMNNQSFICPEIVREANSFSMGIQLVDDTTIKSLNCKWRKKDNVTDVLSFSVLDYELPVPANEDVELGDIIVSVTTANRQALAHDHDLEMELRWLVCHGFLHLLGWDHHDSETLKQMLVAQEQLLENNVNVHHMFS